MVELCGLAGSGKTEFLYAAAISNVLQDPNRHVVYLDLDYKFEPYRVSYLLQHRLQMDSERDEEEAVGQGANQQPTALSVEAKRQKLMEKVNKTFERLHVFSCSSSLQFLATLKVLGTDFVPSLYERGGTLGVIIVDNISAYWDVLRELKSNQIGSSKASKSRGGEPQLSMIEAIVHSLTELRNMCDVPVLVSRRVPREMFHDVGNRQWNDFVVKRASLGCRRGGQGGHGGQDGRGGPKDGGGPRRRQIEHGKNQQNLSSDANHLERTLCWVKGEQGSITYIIHPSQGIT